MKLHTRITAFLFIIVFALPTAALAADPLEDYNEFVPTGREDEDLTMQCKEQLGIGADENPVAAVLYNLRRCISAKKRAAAHLKRQEQIAGARRSKRFETKVGKQSYFQRRAEQSLRNRLRRNVGVRRTFRQKDNSVKSDIIKQRSTRRSLVRQREQERTKQVNSVRNARNVIILECGYLRGAERRQCILDQIRGVESEN